MSYRISPKQRLVLEAIQDRPKYKGRDGCLCYDHMPEEVWWSFWSEWQALQWCRKMEARGLIRIEQDCFLYLTDFGKAALAHEPKKPTAPTLAEAVAKARGSAEESSGDGIGGGE